MQKIKILFFICLLIIYLFLPFKIFAQKEQICEFSRWLYIGAKGEDVKCLQEFLKNEGFFKYPFGPTGYYGIFTKKAVEEWQKVNEIKPVSGYFGSKSYLKYLDIILKKTEIKTTSSQITSINKFNFTTFELLHIPQIQDSEFKISENGLKDFIEYLKRYNLLEIPIDSTKINILFSKIEINSKSDDYSLIPHLLIEETFNNPEVDINKITQKLEVLENFFQEKIKIVKELNIHPDLKEIHRILYITDLLTIDLIKKFKEYQNNNLSRDMFEKYLKEYKIFIEATDTEISQKFFKKFYLQNKRQNKFFTVLNIFLNKLVKPVYAFGIVHFGGKVLKKTSCFCPLPGGILFSVSSPRGGTFFASSIFLTSPLFYKWKKLDEGVWVLGNAFDQPVVCGFPSMYGCTIFGIGKPVFMMGTSL